jgi:hypothetical protein
MFEATFPHGTYIIAPVGKRRFTTWTRTGRVRMKFKTAVKLYYQSEKIIL